VKLFSVIYRHAEEKKSLKKKGGKRRKSGKKGKGAGKRTGAKPKAAKGNRKPREKTGRKRR
jgi:hypothetical protein